MTQTDPAAERGVLAGIFAHGGEAYLDVADIITPGTLTVGSNEVIYRCLEKIVKDDPDARPDLPGVLSAANALGLGGLFEDRDEVKHLRSVMNMAPLVQLPTVRRLAGKVKKLRIANILDQQLDASKLSLEQVTGEEPIAHILGLVENPIFDLTSCLADTSSQGVVSMGDGALEYVTYLMDNPREMVGISTGMDLFDEAIGGGLRANGFDIVAARQKTGKTFLVDNVGKHVATQGIHVLNVDKEMTKEEHLNRILANMAGLSIRDIERGKYAGDAARRRKLEDAAARLKDLPYDYLPAMGMPDEDVLAHMRRWVTRKVGLGADGKAKPCVIIYDWLKLNSAGDLSKNMQEYQLLGFLTSTLKNFMGRYGVACLCFAQLNREGIDTEDTSVIRGSDRILDFCTSFSIYKWKSEDEKAEELGKEVRYTHKLIPVIARHGPGMQDGDYINVASDYARGRIVEGPTRNGRGGKRAGTGGGVEVSSDGTESFSFGPAEGPGRGPEEGGEAA